jgi:acylglycerol lipase
MNRMPDRTNSHQLTLHKNARRAIFMFLILLLQTASAFAVGLNYPAVAQDGDPNDRVSYVEDGEFSKILKIPTYEWIPKNTKPVGVVLAIHGLTLHGKRYEVLGKAFAAEGIYACAPDMRGFGRCYKDPDNKFSTPTDDKHKVDYEKAYGEIVNLAVLIRHKYPNVPMFAMGESLGTSACIRLAADHPELINGLILSGPTVRVHPLMFSHPHNVAAAGYAILVHPKFNMNTAPFVKNLVSNDANIVQEMLDDPLCRKGLTIAELMKTGRFVKDTLKNARQLKTNVPILVLQGSEDRCMVPQAVTRLSKNIQSADQTLRWLHAHGHLLLETHYLRPATVDSIDEWTREHQFAHLNETKKLKEEIIKLGAQPITDEK